MPPRLTLLLIFLFTAIPVVRAQPASTPFITRTFTAQDGLPHSYIYSVLQDSKGYLWVGTRFGLGRFDGLNFTNINIHEIAPNNIIGWIHEDEKGKIWLGTESSIYVMDGNKISLYDSGSSIFLTPVIKPGNHRPSELWALNGKTMKRLDDYGGVQPVLVPDFGTDYCRRAVFTPQGNYFNLTSKIVFADKQGRHKTLIQLNPFTDFIVLLGYWGNQLYFYSKQGVYTVRDNKIIPLFRNQLKRKNIYSAYRDHKNRFWVATEQHGILISTAGNEEEFSYSIKPSHNLISGFYEDKEGNTWIAGFEGLIKVQENIFESYSGKQYPFLSDMNQIAKDRNGVIFTFSETYGYGSWNTGNFSSPPNNPLKKHLVDALCLDDKNRFWCITRRNQLICFDGGKTDFIRDRSVILAHDLEPDILYDDYRKKIWLPGETLLWGDEKGFSEFKDANLAAIKLPKRLLYTRKGKILVSTSDNQLFLINQNNNISKISIPEIIPPKGIYRFFTDSLDNIWISYPGLGFLQCRLLNDTHLKILDRYSTENGLTNDFVQSMAYDRLGRIWLSTMAGIAIIDIRKKNREGSPVFLIGKEEGIPFSGLEYSRLLCADNGDMWYSTQHSLMKFHAGELALNTLPPITTIEEVLLNNRQTNWRKYTDSLDGIFQIPVNPVLKYFENTITIVFKGATMTNGETIKYSYLLSGISDFWSSSSKSNTITFTKLKPGTYTFFVRARTNSHSWGMPALFTFTIRKPYWQQNWFIVACSLLGFGILYLIYRFRLRQLKKEARIRNQIARDLHDDLGSTLNSVKVYASIASLEPGNREPLEKIMKGTQDAISGVRDLVWVLDEKKDTLEHLFARLGQFAAPLCEANHVKYRQDLENGLYAYLLNREEKRNLYLIIKEAINNCIKYACCRNITISGVLEKKKLRLTISDDGCGFNLEKVLKGHGLENILTRAKEIHYHAEFRSAPGEGTSLILEKK